MPTWIERIGDEFQNGFDQVEEGVEKVKGYVVDQITSLIPKLGINADIDAAITLILDDSVLKVVDRIAFALSESIDKVGAIFQSLVKQVFRELSELVDRVDETVNKIFQNISNALADIKKNLIDPIVDAVFDFENKLVDDINQVLDKIFDFYQGSVQEFRDSITRGTSLLVPNPLDPCRRKYDLGTTLGLDLTHIDIFNLFECGQLNRLEDSSTKIREITEVYAGLQLQSFRLTCLGRGSRAFQEIYTKKWIEYGQLYDLWKGFDEDMTAQQAFNEAIRRLNQARNEYLSNPAPIIESGSVSRSYWQNDSPVGLGVHHDASHEKRRDEIHVDFSVGKFSSPPKVQVMLNTIDTYVNANTRLSVTPINITNAGFDIQIGTWGDSRVYGVEVVWIAHTD